MSPPLAPTRNTVETMPIRAERAGPVGDAPPTDEGMLSVSGIKSVVQEWVQDRAEALGDKSSARADIEDRALPLITSKKPTFIARSAWEERQARRASRRLHKRFLIGFEKALAETQIQGFGPIAKDKVRTPDEFVRQTIASSRPPSERRAAHKTRKDINRLERRFSGIRNQSERIMSRSDRTARFMRIRGSVYEEVAQRMAAKNKKDEED